MSDGAPDPDGPVHLPSLELSRPFPVSRIGAGARFVVEAKSEECARLAVRMGLLAVHALTCRFDLRRDGGEGSIEASALLQARIQQTCVVSLDPFDTEVAEKFTIRFVPAGTESPELDLDADDEVTYDGATLELGEAASEQLALALDPFPRKPGAELPGSVVALESGPFAGLAKLLPPH